jgi:hypothetical protein
MLLRPAAVGLGAWLILAALATDAGAQTISKSDRQPAARVLGSLYISNAVLHGLDVHSTLKGIRSGAAEANPVMKGLVKHPAAFIATKAAVSFGTIMASRSIARRHRVAAVVTLAAINVLYGAIVHHNYRAARQVQ